MKITITIEDSPLGKVKVQCDPTFETLAKMINAGHHSTSAQGYAMVAINAIRKASKEQALKMNIPRIGKA